MAVDSTSILTGLVGCLATFFLWSLRSKATIAVPPGPRPIPILGNIRDLPPKEPWLWATRLAKQYGEIVYLHYFGRGVVFLNSAESAYDLLDKRGLIYSDRPSSVMVGELCGINKMVPFMSYCDSSKRQRKLMNKALGASAIPPYRPLLQSGTITFLRKLIQSPSNYVEHARWYAGGFTLSVVFGYEPAPQNDEFLALASGWGDVFSYEILNGGALWPVDVIPVLRYLPSWFPGAGFKRKAARCFNTTEEFAAKPYEFTKKNIDSGDYRTSFCSTLLENQEVTKQLDYDIKWTACSMYAGSSDSTIATVSNFLLLMLKHPDVLLKARAEIDSVVGTERLPNFDDREHLPYVDAVLSETWRWTVPLPFTIPHCLRQDDIYKDMLIPKGTWVIANIWLMLRDERLYPNPSRFDPERFMEKVDDETRRRRDPRHYIFGFGRRLCPGLHLVEDSIWLLVVCMIATLDISKPVDKQGYEIEPNPSYENELVRTPTPFKAVIKPRSEQAARLIMEETGL